MHTSSRLVFLAAAASLAGCSKSSTADGRAAPAETPPPSAPAVVAKPAAEVATPAADPWSPPSPGSPPSLFEGAGRVRVGGGAAELAIVDADLQIEVVLLTPAERRVIARLDQTESSSFALRGDGDGALLIERAMVADADVFSTEVTRFRWDAARGTSVAGEHAYAGPDEPLPAWVPEGVRSLHDGTDRLAAIEHLCEPYAPQVANRAKVGPGVDIMLVCNTFEGAPQLVAFAGRTRTDVHEMHADAMFGIAQVPDRGTYFVEEWLRPEGVVTVVFEVTWSEEDGVALRALDKVPAFLRRLLPAATVVPQHDAVSAPVDAQRSRGEPRRAVARKRR